MGLFAKKDKWGIIANGSLEHQGRAFTMEWHKEMPFIYAFLDSTKQELLRSDQKDAYLLALQHPGITVHTKYGKFGSARDKKGYIIVVTVPERISAQCYAEVYANEGLPFRDYLLKNHRSLLLEICRDYRFDQRYGSEFYISRSGMAEAVNYNGDWYVHFKDYGMENLSSPAQCYGFALAVLEILKTDIFKDYPLKNISFSHHNSTVESIGVRFTKVRETPTLNKW